MTGADTTPAERRYRGLTAEARRAERRRRLLDTGLDLFAAAGYAGTTIEQICATAGVTARHFYEHFAAREDLLLAVYDEVVDAHLAGLAAGLPDDPLDLDTIIRAASEAGLRGWADDVRRARIAFVEVVGVTPRVEQHRLAVLDRYAAFIAATADELARRGLIPERDRRLIAHALTGAVSQLMVHWLHDPHRPPIDRVVDEFAAMQLALLRHIE